MNSGGWGEEGGVGGVGWSEKGRLGGDGGGREMGVVCWVAGADGRGVGGVAVCGWAFRQ